MIRKLHGIVQGRLIKLTDDPGIADGREVEVTVREAGPPRTPGDGIRRSAGALFHTWSDDDDRILSDLSADRARSSSRELPE